MTLKEAANIAWHIRVNGLDDVKPEHIKGAMAVLEQLVEREPRVQLVLARVDIGLVDAAEAVSNFKIGSE
jgi:hypothetical protein